MGMRDWTRTREGWGGGGGWNGNEGLDLRSLGAQTKVGDDLLLE